MGKNSLEDKVKKFKIYYLYFMNCSYAAKLEITKRVPNFGSSLNQTYKAVEAHEHGILNLRPDYLDNALQTFKMLVSAEKIRGFRNELILNDFRNGIPINDIAERYGVTVLTVKNVLGF